MSLLSISNITVGYGKAIVLQNLSLTVEAGKICALLGSNGSGKTTLIKTILGLVKPTVGRIEFDGRPILGMDTHRANQMGITIVPEGRKIFPEMSVMENLRMGCFNENRKEVIQARMEEIFGIFPRLKERADQPGGTLSGGEQGMLAIGRAMMGEPRLMILDEPSLGLQPNLVELMFDIIQEINKDRNTTILLSEQNAKRTLEIADSGYVLQKGRIIAQGSAAEVAANEIVQKAYLKADSSLIEHSETG